MPGNQFGVAEKGKYLESSKKGTSGMTHGGMRYKSGQSGTVSKSGDTGSMPTPKANMQYPHNSGGKVRY